MSPTIVLKPCESYTCHIVPCQIQYTGEVDNTLLTATREPERIEQENAMLAQASVKETLNDVVYLRGRKLLGRNVDMASYTGHLLQREEVHGGNDEPSTQFSSVGRFDTMTLFSHEQVPDLVNSQWGTLAEMIEMADLVHGD